MASEQIHRPLLLIPLLLLMATGCGEDCEYTESTQVHITTDIHNKTRTSMSGTTASFTSGDKIGVFETLTNRSNVSYTYNGSAWSTTTPMYWYNGTANHTFYAYYPYNATASGLKAAIPVLSTQNIATTPGPAWDMLVAGPRTQTRSAGVPLTFTHAFAMIQLNIKMGILIINPYYLNRITIQGGNSTGSNRYGIVNITGNPSQAGYDFSTNTVSAATNDASSYAQSFFTDMGSMSLLTSTTPFYAFVLPGAYTNPAAAVSFRITTLLLGTRNSAFLNFSNTTFQAGTKYVYDVSIGLLNRSAAPQITLVLQETVPCDNMIIEQPI